MSDEGSNSNEDSDATDGKVIEERGQTLPVPVSWSHQLMMARPCQNWPGWPDVVATQGTHLVPSVNTPVFEKAYDEEFVTKLSRALELVITITPKTRRIKYRQAADEWPIGHTPPEVKERRAAELRAMEEARKTTSDESSDNDEDSDATVDGKSGAKKGQAPPVRGSRPQSLQPGWLLTPPLSANNSIPTPHGKKRRRMSTSVEEDEKEEKRPRRTHITSTTRADSLPEEIPKGFHEKCRKRRRADDVDDKGEEDREHPTKACKTAFPSSGQR
ncbi:MAG: hypothetical protein Q9190_006081 [Brigantiaea leucoxantha]